MVSWGFRELGFKKARAVAKATMYGLSGECKDRDMGKGYKCVSMFVIMFRP